MELTTLQDIRKDIEKFKVTALTLASAQITNVNAIHLEPRELKTLVDIVLNIEDSYKNSINEGEQARKIKRLLDKYTDTGITPQDYIEVELNA